MERASCFCGGVQGGFDEEFPCIRQGVMHSPVGCLRKELALWQEQRVIEELTGYRVYQEEPKAVFTVLMDVLSKKPQLAELLNAVVTRVPPLPKREFSPEVHEKPRGRVPVPPTGSNITAKPPTVSFTRGPIKPPWEK